jgi:uroporphyrinogen III methyltransferase/synthase
MSLERKTILITRPHEQATEFAAELVRRGATAVVIPLLRITDPDDWTPCDRALREIASYDAVMFTSANSVRKFCERGRTTGMNPAFWMKTKCYAVGEKTADELRRNAIAVEFVPETFSAQSLAATLQREVWKCKNVLLPKGNLGREELEETLKHLGANVDVIVVYKNAPPESSVLEEVRQRVMKDEFDVVTFTSPSAAAHFARVVSPALLARGKAKIAVIGPTTRSAVRRLGFPVDIEARTSTSRGLVEAIEMYFNT